MEESFANHRKINRTKKWSRVFAESVENRDPIPEKVNTFRGENMTVFFAKTAVAKKLHSLAKVKLYDRGFSCKRTIENLVPPNPFGEYKKYWKTASLCDVCMKPALSNSLICQSCDMVIHIGCCTGTGEDLKPIPSTPKTPMTPKTPLLKTPTHASITPSASTPKTAHPSTGGKVMICSNCRQTWREEEMMHERDLDKVLEERRLKLYGKYLAKIIFTFLTRRNYLRQRVGITKIQSILRGHMTRKKFLQFRRRFLRVLHLNPIVIPKLDNKSLVVFTVFDNVKNVQLFRLDKQVDRMSDEGFIIPGIATNVNLVLTLVTLEAQHQILGQACLSLRDLDPYVAQDITFSLTGNIVWPPLESREEKIVFDISPDRPPHLNKVFKFRYTPLHPVLSMVAAVTAPPLDILRRPVESYVISSHNTVKAATKAKERTTRWWICLAELKLAFYQYQGDSKQRYVANIRDTTVAVSRDQNKTCIVNFGDRKKWLVNFSSPSEAKRFAFIVSESKKALEGTSSVYFKNGGVEFVYNTVAY